MHERQVVVATFSHEWNASLVRNSLLSEGIPCMIAGAFTGSFRTEVPPRVTVLVRESDVARAEAAIKRLREEAMTIDWSKIDVGGEVDGDLASPDDPDHDDAR